VTGRIELFTEVIPRVRAFVSRASGGRSWPAHREPSWPAGGGRNIVLKDDLGLELGSPERESLSCLLWTHDLSAIEDGRVTLVGPDFPESSGMSLPFGRVVLAGVEGFTADNAYDRHKDLDFLRYGIDLKGFMLRSASQYRREWCRVGTAALKDGFSARHLGSALMGLLRTKPYLKAVEVIYLTSSPADVIELREITSPAERIIGAMNKMASEMDFDCETCDYQPVCDDASALKAMRDSLREKSVKEAVHNA